MKIAYGRRFAAVRPTIACAPTNVPLVALTGDYAHNGGTEPSSWFHLQKTSLMLRYILMEEIYSARLKGTRKLALLAVLGHWCCYEQATEHFCLSLESRNRLGEVAKGSSRPISEQINIGSLLTMS